MSSAAVVNYNDLEAAKKQELQTQIQRRLRDKVQGSHDGIRLSVLRLVVDGHYERATEEIDRFVESKTQYPRFEMRSRPFKKHCKDLIFAIESKRHFPGLSQLSSSKHQELFDKVVEHFEELKNILIKIEIVEKEEKVKDLKSTVILVRAFWTCLFTVIVVAFALAVVTDGLAFSMNVVFDDALNKTLEKVFAVF